jgi:hypothetical protein
LSKRKEAAASSSLIGTEKVLTNVNISAKMTRNWSKVKSTFKNLSLASSLRPKKRSVKNKTDSGQESPPELDGTSKDLDEKGADPLTSDEAPTNPAHHFFEVSSGKGKLIDDKKEEKKRKSKTGNEIANAGGAETTEMTEEGGAALAYAFFGIDDPSDDYDSANSLKASPHHKFGADNVFSEKVPENQISSVKTEPLKKGNKSQKNHRKLKMTEEKEGTDRKTNEKWKVDFAKSADVLQEEVLYICKALGMDTFKFFCLRHPDQVITNLSPCYEPVQRCSLCDLEFQADPNGLEEVQRGRVAAMKEKVLNSLLNDTEHWKERTKIENWHPGCHNEILSGGVSDEGKEAKISETEWLDQVLERSLQVLVWKTLGDQPLGNDPDYARYFRLFRVGVPLDAVKFTAERDGFDPTVLDLSPDLPLKSQRPVDSKDDSHSHSDTNSDEQNDAIPETLEKIHVAFNRLRAKNLLQGAALAAVKKRNKERQVKDKNGGPKKACKVLIGGKKKGKNDKKRRTDKGRKSSSTTNEGKKDDANEKDLMILRLQDELAKKELEIESLHEKVHEMKQQIQTHSSFHRSLGSISSFDKKEAPSISKVSDAIRSGLERKIDSELADDDAYDDAYDEAFEFTAAVFRKNTNNFKQEPSENAQDQLDSLIGVSTANESARHLRHSSSVTDMSTDGKHDISDIFDGAGERSFGSSSNEIETIMVRHSQNDGGASSNVAEGAVEDIGTSGSVDGDAIHSNLVNDANAMMSTGHRKIERENLSLPSECNSEPLDTADAAERAQDTIVYTSIIEAVPVVNIAADSNDKKEDSLLDLSDNKCTSASSDSYDGAPFLSSTTGRSNTGTSASIASTSSDMDQDFLELAAFAHAKEQNAPEVGSADSFQDEYVSGPVSGAPLLEQPADAILLSPATNNQGVAGAAHDNDNFDLVLLASSLHDANNEDMSESFDDECDSADSSQGKVEQPTTHSTTILSNSDAVCSTSNFKEDGDHDELELAEALHENEHDYESENPLNSLVNDYTSDSSKVSDSDGLGAHPTNCDALSTIALNGFSFESVDADHLDLALAGSVQASKDNQIDEDVCPVPDHSQIVNEFSPETSTVVSGNASDAMTVNTVQLMVLLDVSVAASRQDDDDDLLSEAAGQVNHLFRYVNKNDYDSAAWCNNQALDSTSDGAQNEVNGFDVACTDNAEGGDDAILELASSLHANEQEDKNVVGQKQDYFVDEYTTEVPRTHENKNSSSDEYNAPDGLDAISNGNDNGFIGALNLGAAVHGRDSNVNDNSVAESFSDDDYSSVASEAVYAVVKNTTIEPIASDGDGICFTASSSDDDDDDDDAAVLDRRAARLHADGNSGEGFSDSNHQNPCNENHLRQHDPPPLKHPKFDLLNADGSSDNEDDELMMAVALLAREDDSSVGDRGGILGFDEELEALQLCQQADGLFNGGQSSRLAPCTDNLPIQHHGNDTDDSESSDSSYEPASSEGDYARRSSHDKLDGNDSDYAPDVSEDDSYESYGSYESYADDGLSAQGLV